VSSSDIALEPATSGIANPVAGWADYLALLKPRVMSLVIFTALTGFLCAGGPVDPALAAQLLRLPAVEGPPSDIATDTLADAQWLDDALEEAVFVDQRRVEAEEQTHFDRAVGQLERFVEDKILVSRRDRTGLQQKLQSARARRDKVVGATARDQVEAEIAQLAGKNQALESRLEALESREDEVYQKWRGTYYERRYQAPTVTRLFQAAFEILPPAEETSC